MKMCLTKVRGSLLCALLLTADVLAAGRGADLPIGRLSESGYGDWTPSGNAFSTGPASGDLLGRLEIENATGALVISSEREGDAPTGTLTSPEFKLARDYIAFRVAGGDYERDTCVHLLIAGKVVRSSTGWRSDRLAPESWDVREFRGRKARVRIVDLAKGDWGHINVAGLVQTDTPERLPVSPGPLYHEALRPQFHFTARQWTINRLNPGMQQEGWINDLNGLIYYEGEYHLFAQRWAKCWLHAVSKDLVHWTELEPAFWEEQPGTGAQSGTCVVDYQNSSGLSASKDTPPLIAFFPRWDNRGQCLAFSLDRGRSWKFYDKNPILTHPERDPKVFWFAPARHWVMMLYGDGQYHILTSTNLLNWADQHHPIKDSFECPDFFELPVDGDPARMKWVLIQGNGNYSIGTFDGTEFKEETGRLACDLGPNFYATQTWGNVETGDGRRVQTAWMRSPPFPDMPFNQQISFPCELQLRTTPGGLRLFRAPVKEIATLHLPPDTWTNRLLKPDQELRLEPAGECFHLRARVRIAEGSKLRFNLRGNAVVLTDRTVESGTRPASVAGRVETVEILLDKGSIETFVNEGELSATRFALPTENGLSVKAEGGSVELRSVEVYPVRSIWPEPRQ